ncbi:MAG: VCBS repeat-containing protein, partial [Myxococcales bacterium]|nr:VCBS repeat-containing protein [Myxococcales bacterium]
MRHGARSRLAVAGAACALVVCLVGADARSRGGKKAKSPAASGRSKGIPKPSPASAPTRAAKAGTLDRLVRAFDKRLTRALAGRDLRRSDLVLVMRAGRGTPRALRDVVQRLVVARLARRSLRSHSVWPDTLDAARLKSRARMAGAELALDLTLALNNGYLHLRGEIFATDSSLWRDTVRPRRGTLAHLHASLRADAEVRAFSGPRSRKRLSFAQHDLDLGWRTVLAMVVADLDGDGRRELFILEPRRVELWRYDGKDYKRVSFLPLPAPLASVRPRRDMGTLVVADLDGDGKSELLVRSSVHEQCVEIVLRGDKLEKRRTLHGYPLMPLEVGGKRALLMGTAGPGVDWFPSSALSVDGGQANGSTDPAVTTAAVSSVMQLLPVSFYGLSATQIASAKGPRRYAAALDVKGRLYIYDGKLSRTIGSSAGIGVGFAL